MAAIESGIFTTSTKQRLTELEEKKARLEQTITIESAREKCLLTKEDIERYILDAVKLNAKQMVELLVERIDVFENKICIKLKYSDTSPDGPDKQTNKELTREFENEEIDALSNDNMNETSRRDGDGNSRRGGLIFMVKKSYTVNQKRRYRSGRIRTFTYTIAFTVEFYI